MIETSILRERIHSCERRQAFSALWIGVGIIFQQIGGFFDIWLVENLGAFAVLVGLGILTYSMYRSFADY